ncbi:MAG: hypothetical protein GY810_12715 [Aureispira sp.]|nr:hypothetical protein [Aureispira sp.]
MKQLYFLCLFMVAMFASSCDDSTKPDTPDNTVNTTTDTTAKTIDPQDAPEIVEETNITMTKIEQVTLPFSLDFDPDKDGEIIDIHQIEDGSGFSYIVRAFNTANDKHNMSVMYYKLAEGEGAQIGKFEKSIDNCEFDLMNEHKTDGMQVSDLDGDGLAEFTCMFTLDCTSDVSPLATHLVVFENDQVYSLSGNDKVEGEGGDFKADENMETEEAFLNQSKSLWEKYAFRDL